MQRLPALERNGRQMEDLQVLTSNSKARDEGKQLSPRGAPLPPKLSGYTPPRVYSYAASEKDSPLPRDLSGAITKEEDSLSASGSDFLFSRLSKSEGNRSSIMAKLPALFGAPHDKDMEAHPMRSSNFVAVIDFDLLSDSSLAPTGGLPRGGSVDLMNDSCLSSPFDSDVLKWDETNRNDVGLRKLDLNRPSKLVNEVHRSDATALRVGEGSARCQANSLESHGNLNSDSCASQRREFFERLQHTVDMLAIQRETYDLTQTASTESIPDISLPLVSLKDESVITKENKKFYFDSLTSDEQKLIDQLLSEAMEIKERMGPKYGIDTVQGSWAAFINSPQIEEFGRELYQSLIEEHVLIPSQLAHMSQEDCAHVILKMIDRAVAAYDNSRALVDLMTRAGVDHQRFGIHENELFIMRNAVLRLVQKYIPPERVEAAEKDWNRFWKLCINLMMQGGNTPEGLMNRKLYEEDYAKQIQELVQTIAEKQQHLELEQHFVNVMFDISRTVCPHLEKFRALFKTRHSCDRFFNSIAYIANNISRHEVNGIYMQEVGGRHVAYDVTREILENFEVPFVQAARQLLGEEAWDITVQHNCELFYRSMVKGVSAGMDSGKDTAANRWAPDGSEPFCLLFTDVESSTNLWQRYPTIMREAIDKHHRIIRTVIADFGGYEVKTAGDSFIIAVKDVLAGLKIAVAIQLELMRQVPIAEGFEMLDDVQGHGDPEAWNKQTLRVRIGIQHCTEATATYDSIHRRYDYYGTSVNQCARIQAAAAGGQILMSRETFKALKAIPAFHDEPCPAYLRDIEGNSELDERGFDHFVAMCDVGKVKLKGIKRPVHLASVVPMCLAGRDFTPKNRVL